MEIEFAGEVVEWRGPAPYLFVALMATRLSTTARAGVVAGGAVASVVFMWWSQSGAPRMSIPSLTTSRIPSLT